MNEHDLVNEWATGVPAARPEAAPSGPKLPPPPPPPTMKGLSHAGRTATEPARAGRLAAALLVLPLLLGLAAPAAAQARNTIAFPKDTIYVAEGAEVIVTPALRNPQSTRTYLHMRTVEPEGNLDGYAPARIGTEASAHVWPLTDRRGGRISAGETTYLQPVVINPGSRGRYFFIEITKVTTDGELHSTAIDTSVALGTPSRVTVFIVAAEDSRMPQVVLTHNRLRVDEPQADNCSDSHVGDEKTYEEYQDTDDQGLHTRIRVMRNYGPVLKSVDYRVSLDRSPGAGKVVSVEIWEPTDLDSSAIDPFVQNARIHGIGWPPVRQGRISIDNSPVLNRGQPSGDRRHLNTYLTFTDENWTREQTVTVNIHCARHDVTTPLPVWHFAFRHDTSVYSSHHFNRKGDNSSANTSLKIAEVRVADSTEPDPITGNVDGNLVLDPDASGYFVLSDDDEDEDGYEHIIGLDFHWNNPDNSLHNDYDDASGKFAGFRVSFRTVDPPGHAVQEEFVRADFIIPGEAPTTASWRAELEANGYDYRKRFEPNRPDRKYEWSVVPVDRHWNDVEAERVTRCVLMTGNTLDLTANPTCPAPELTAQDGGICGRTPAVRNAIVGRIPGVSHCRDVTPEHLAAITGRLNLESQDLSGLQQGDLDGLTALTELIMYDSRITTLPAGIFDDLAALTQLDLRENQIGILPAGIFDRLTKLTELNLRGMWASFLGPRRSNISTLPAGIFDRLTKLTVLYLNSNDISTLPAGIFDKLTALNFLHLQDTPGAPFAQAANAGPDQAVSTGAQVTLSGGTAAGPWGDNVRLRWFQVDGPASNTVIGGVLPGGVWAATHTFTAPSTPGELHFRLASLPRAWRPSWGTNRTYDWVTITVGGGQGSPQQVDQDERAEGQRGVEDETDGGKGPVEPGPAPVAVDLPAAVAHWRLDGDAGDSAGSSHGIVAGGATFAANGEGGGVGSHALVLDGSDDYVDLAAHVFSLPLGDAARSVTGWFRAEAGSQRQTFLTYGPNLAGQRFSIAADRTQVLVAVSGHAWGVNGLDLSDGWHHVAVTYAGGDSDAISIYLDGALQAASTLVGAPQQVNTRNGAAAIGRSVGGDAHYAGSIDDVRIYDAALGAEQVLALFNEHPQTPPPPAPVTTAVTATASPALAEGSLDGADVELTLDAGDFAETVGTSDVTASGVSGVSVSSVTRDSDTQATATLAFDGTDFDADATLSLTVSADALIHSDAALSATLPVTAVDEPPPPPPPPAVSIPAPAAHWKFDGDADDSAGSSNGSARNGASFTTAAGVGSHALVLDGNDDYVDLASHASGFPLGNAARSVTGWFRADAGNQRQTFLTYGPNVEGKRFSIAADRTQALVAVSGHAWGVNNLSLAEGWHHIAVTFAGGRSDDISIYLDGVKQSASTLGGVARQVDTRTGPAAIGRNVGGNAHYGGDIDDVRLYDYALSVEQVQAIVGRKEGAQPAAAAFPVRAPMGLRQRGWRAQGMSWGMSGAAGAWMHHGATPAGSGAFVPGAPDPGVRTHVPLLPSASNPLRAGLVRIANPSRRAGEVWILAVDDAGRRSQPVVLGMGAGETVEFTSRDLEWGNAAMGLTGAAGPGTGDWRLEVSSGLDVEVLGYARAADGTLSALGGVAPSADNVHRVALFNSADSSDAASLLRLTNRSAQALMADITGIDDTGASPGGVVSVEVGAHESVVLTAAELEAGDTNLLGALGDGEGQWRLRIASDGDLAVMNLVETPDGHLANLSGATATTVPARETHVVDRFPSSSDISNGQGVVRIVNSSERPASVRIEPKDSAGWRYPPLTLTLGANEAANLGALDLELGNAAKGLAGSAGPGTGAWRLAISSDSDIEVLNYTRTPSGLPRVPPGGTAAEDRPR